MNKYYLRLNYSRDHILYMSRNYNFHQIHLAYSDKLHSNHKTKLLPKPCPCLDQMDLSVMSHNLCMSSNFRSDQNQVAPLNQRHSSALRIASLTCCCPFRIFDCTKMSATNLSKKKSAKERKPSMSIFRFSTSRMSPSSSRNVARSRLASSTQRLALLTFMCFIIPEMVLPPKISTSPLFPALFCCRFASCRLSRARSPLGLLLVSLYSCHKLHTLPYSP